MSLDLQPKVTRTWELTPDQLRQIIADAIKVPVDQVTIDFKLVNNEYDDRFGPNYVFAGAKVTSK